MLWSCFLWSGFIERRQRDGKARLQINQDANWGRGKLKPGVTLSTPQRPRYDTQAHSIRILSNKVIILSRHLLVIYICIWINSRLTILPWATHRTQTCPLHRIHFGYVLCVAKVYLYVRTDIPGKRTLANISFFRRLYPRWYLEVNTYCVMSIQREESQSDRNGSRDQALLSRKLLSAKYFPINADRLSPARCVKVVSR